jgi:hypothetical protein
MNTQIATEVPREEAGRRSLRTYMLASLGPLTVAAGVAWAIVQPERITLLHPSGQGFWWLAVQPPLLVVLVGLLFHFLVLPGLLEDLAER